MHMQYLWQNLFFFFEIQIILLDRSVYTIMQTNKRTRSRWWIWTIFRFSCPAFSWKKNNLIDSCWWKNDPTYRHMLALISTKICHLQLHHLIKCFPAVIGRFSRHQDILFLKILTQFKFSFRLSPMETIWIKCQVLFLPLKYLEMIYDGSRSQPFLLLG